MKETRRERGSERGCPSSDVECPVYKFELYLSYHPIMRMLDRLNVQTGTWAPSGKIGIDFLCIEFSASPCLLLRHGRNGAQRLYS